MCTMLSTQCLSPGLSFHHALAQNSILFDSLWNGGRETVKRKLQSCPPCWNSCFPSFLRFCLPHIFTVTRNKTKDREAPCLGVLLFSSNKGSLEKTCSSSALLWRPPVTPWALHHLESPVPGGRRPSEGDEKEERTSSGKQRNTNGNCGPEIHSLKLYP